MALASVLNVWFTLVCSCLCLFHVVLLSPHQRAQRDFWRNLQLGWFSWVETTWSDLAWILDIHRYIVLPNRCNIPAIATAAIPMASAIGCKDCLDNQHVRDSIDDRKSTSEGSPANQAVIMSQPVSCFISGLNSLFLSLWIEFCSLVDVCLMFQARCYSDFYPRHNTAAAAAAATAWCGFHSLVATRFLYILIV